MTCSRATSAPSADNAISRAGSARKRCDVGDHPPSASPSVNVGAAGPLTFIRVQKTIGKRLIEARSDRFPSETALTYCLVTEARPIVAFRRMALREQSLLLWSVLV